MAARCHRHRAACCARQVNGSILSLSEPACLRASTCFHQTQFWEGDRLIIVVFTVKLEATLASSAVRHLMSLGFPLPLSTGDCAATPEPAKFACLDAAATGIPLIVEVFAGSARITECCREVGLRADAIDHKPRPLSKVQPLLLDLTSDIGRRGLRSILSHPDLKAIWWAPPCGTASKARCIPLNVPNAPRPLRTEEWPDGVSGLSKVEQARVDSANSLYHTLADSVKRSRKGSYTLLRILAALYFGRRPPGCGSATFPVHSLPKLRTRGPQAQEYSAGYYA